MEDYLDGHFDPVLHAEQLEFNMTDALLDPRNWTFDMLVKANQSSPTSNWLYGSLVLVGISGNVIFLFSLFRNTDSKARLRPFLLNLALADLVVCCFTLAMEFGWRVTVYWMAGDTACRFFSFMKTLGYYSATFVVVGMSFDRFYGIWFPMKMNDGARRSRIILSIVWTTAVLFSFPQALIFHVERHPYVPEFTQCVTFGYFENESHTRSYVLFGVLTLYVIPLLIIILVNMIILWQLKTNIHLKTPRLKRSFTSTFLSESIPSEQDSMIRENEPTPSVSTMGIALSFVKFQQSERGGNRMRLSTGLILYHSNRLKRERTRSRTVALSLLIVGGFVLCYTPYAVLIFSSLIVDQETHERMMQGNEKLTEGLLVFTLCFSVVINPLIYGSYMIHTRALGFRKALTWFARKFAL